MIEENIYTFRLLLQGPDDDSTADALMAACGDMLLGTQGSRLSADFDRPAATFESAVLSAIRDLETASTYVTVERVEPDDLVTATVIADRTGRTRQSVSLLIAGERGPGAFPEPLAFVDAKTRLWRWSEVAAWLEATGIATDDSTPRTALERRFLAALNGALETRLNLRAYRHNGGDDSSAAAVRDVAGQGLASADLSSPRLAAHAADGGRDITLTTGVGLLDLAVQLLGQSRASAPFEAHDDHHPRRWMRTSIAGFQGTLRLYLAGRPAEASPFEELVAGGFTCAALMRVQHHGSRTRLDDALRLKGPIADPLKTCLACDGSAAHPAWSSSSATQRRALRAVLVDDLKAPEHVFPRIAVWLTHSEEDHVNGLASILTAPVLENVWVTHNWDDTLDAWLAEQKRGNDVASPRTHKGRELREARNQDWVVLTSSQRLWATTWSFGQTLYLFAEQECPQRVEAVRSALNVLERLP